MSKELTDDDKLVAINYMLSRYNITGLESLFETYDTDKCIIFDTMMLFRPKEHGDYNDADEILNSYDYVNMENISIEFNGIIVYQINDDDGNIFESYVENLSGNISRAELIAALLISNLPYILFDNSVSDNKRSLCAAVIDYHSEIDYNDINVFTTQNYEGPGFVLIVYLLCCLNDNKYIYDILCKQFNDDPDIYKIDITILSNLYDKCKRIIKDKKTPNDNDDECQLIEDVYIYKKTNKNFTLVTLLKIFLILADGFTDDYNNNLLKLIIELAGDYIDEVAKLNVMLSGYLALSYEYSELESTFSINNNLLISPFIMLCNNIPAGTEIDYKYVYNFEGVENNKSIASSFDFINQFIIDELMYNNITKIYKQYADYTLEITTQDSKIHNQTVTTQLLGFIKFYNHVFSTIKDGGGMWDKSGGGVELFKKYTDYINHITENPTANIDITRITEVDKFLRSGWGKTKYASKYNDLVKLYDNLHDLRGVELKNADLKKISDNDASSTNAKANAKTTINTVVSTSLTPEERDLVKILADKNLEFLGIDGTSIDDPESNDKYAINMTAVSAKIKSLYDENELGEDYLTKVLPNLYNVALKYYNPYVFSFLPPADG